MSRAWPWMARKPRNNTTARVPRVPRASTQVRAAMKRLRVPVVRKGKRLK